MEIIKPNEMYFDEYLSACKESYDNDIKEWMPVELNRFGEWRASALKMYEMLESGEGLPDGVPRMYTYWCVENGRFIGEIQIRPFIDEITAKSIGHIGYAIRYSMWNKGYGTKVLNEAIKKLQELGVSTIYIACHESNVASNIVSKKCGFKLLEKAIDETTNERQNVYIVNV